MYLMIRFSKIFQGGANAGVAYDSQGNKYSRIRQGFGNADKAFPEPIMESEGALRARPTEAQPKTVSVHLC